MPFALPRSAALALLSATLALGQPPATPQRPVTDTYHGVPVIDNYRWLEKDADPEVPILRTAKTEYGKL